MKENDYTTINDPVELNKLTGGQIPQTSWIVMKLTELYLVIQEKIEDYISSKSN